MSEHDTYESSTEQQKGKGKEWKNWKDLKVKEVQR